MKKIMTIFGTRPEAIKMAPVIRALNNHPGKFQSLVCVTAQHRQMLDQVLDLFEIQPEYDLNIMKPGQDLFDITCSVIQRLKPVLKKEKPDLVPRSWRHDYEHRRFLGRFLCRLPGQ